MHALFQFGSSRLEAIEELNIRQPSSKLRAKIGNQTQFNAGEMMYPPAAKRDKSMNIFVGDDRNHGQGHEPFSFQGTGLEFRIFADVSADVGLLGFENRFADNGLGPSLGEKP